ncbi:MAG: IS5 family transposase [Sphingobacteriaceae bacterium]|nr:MAG: IS5 family transposase [Sphingobacteriaceae bacterium]
MPYKERVKTGLERKREKPKYKVQNWTEYNQSLRKRGMISLYFPEGDIKSQFINNIPYVKGESGRMATYLAPYIQLIYIVYRLFGWGQRQITGYFEDLWKTKGLDITVPSFGHLCDLFSQVSIKVKQFCNKICKKIKDGETIDLIVDSTGLTFGKASDWYETKYNKLCDNRPWKKMHISNDPDLNIHAVEITDYDVADIDVLDQLMPQEIEIDKLIADGGYYSIAGADALNKKGITPVIPPPSHSVVHGLDDTKWHDKIVQYIKDKGSVYAFHKKYGYGKRALAESQFSRIKRCIGSSLLTQKPESQKQEGQIIANIINQWNSFGRCVSVKIG